MPDPKPGPKPNQEQMNDTAQAILTEEQARFIRRARVGHLATASADGTPHLVPVCFEMVDEVLYVGLDDKPKSVAATRLKRIRNILENPIVAFLVDRYDDEDWSRLGFVLITARAELLLDAAGNEHERAVRALKRKYRQYETLLRDDATVIRITPLSVSRWGETS